MDFFLAYFSVSGVQTWVFVPPLVAFIVSFFTSMGGVSGAFLLLPFQMSFLGYTNPSVSATNQLFNIVAIPSGVYRYYREGRMVWPLTWVVVAGTLPGVFIGAIVRVVYLPDPKSFKLFAAGVLLYVGLRMGRDLTRKVAGDQGPGEKRFRDLMRNKFRRTGVQGNPSQKPLPVVKVTHFNRKRLGYVFHGEQFDIPFWSIFALSFVVGIVGGIYGVGGGAIIAPFFVTFLGLPVYTVAGAALMGTFVTSVAGVGFYQVIAPFYPNMSIAPDWLRRNFFWTWRNGRDVPGRPVSEVCPAPGHQVDARRHHRLHCPEVCRSVFRPVSKPSDAAGSNYVRQNTN